MSQRPGEARAEPSSATSPFQPIGGSGSQERARVEDLPMPPGFVVSDDSVEGLVRRVAKLERRIRVQFFALVIVCLGGLALFFDELLVEDVIVQQKLMESKELTLLDNDGNARLFLRMYSKVPVLQIMDGNGRPRISLGLRFDDTPFLDLSDRTGRTRATFEMTEDDSPAIRLFDENGNPTFNIN